MNTHLSKLTWPSLTAACSSSSLVVIVIALGLISDCAAGAISVNGHILDSNTLTFTTPAPGSISRSYSSSILPLKEVPSPGGFWKTRKEWKAYWVKDWAVKKIYVPVWKRVWGPAELREWVPTGVAKPHPGHPGIKHAPLIH